MDKIRIDNLVFSGKHGAYKKARNVEQEFEVYVEISFDATLSARTDKLEDTVDYSGMKNSVREIIEGSSCYLIEKLASNIADKILLDKRIAGVSVMVKKTSVWDNGAPSVTVNKSRR